MIAYTMRVKAARAKTDPKMARALRISFQAGTNVPPEQLVDCCHHDCFTAVSPKAVGHGSEAGRL